MQSMSCVFLALLLAEEPRSVRPTVSKPLRLTLEAADDEVRAVALSPDGSIVAAGTWKDDLILWSRATGKRLFGASLAGDQTGHCDSLVFSPEGKHLATVHNEHLLIPEPVRIHVWEITAGRQLRKVRSFRGAAARRPHGTLRVAFSADGKRLTFADTAGDIRLWELATGHELLRFHGGVAAAFPPDGKSMISVSHDGRIRRWAAGTNRRLDAGPEAPLPDFIHVDAAAFAPGGRWVAVSDSFSTWLKDAATGRTVHRLQFAKPIVPLAFSADDHLLAVSADDGVALFDTRSGKERAWRPGAVAAAFSSDGLSFACADRRSILLENSPVPRTAAAKPPSSTPPQVPLRAELIADPDTYVLDHGGLTTAEFSAECQCGHLPVPRIALKLKLCNTGDKPLTIRRDSTELFLYDGYLVGTGAMNIRSEGRQTGYAPQVLPPPQVITVAPGASLSSRVVTVFDSGWSYALLPGEYTLHATHYEEISPAPKDAWVGKRKDGYGGVWLRLPPVKLRFLPAQGPSADPFERIRRGPVLGAVVVPETAAVRELRDALRRPISSNWRIDGKPTLREVVGFLGQRYGIDFRFDLAALKKAGKESLPNATLKIDPPDDVSLNMVLQLLLEPLDADYEVRGKAVWVVPRTTPRSLTERLEPSAPYPLSKLYKPNSLKPGIPEGTPLAKALQNLSQRYEVRVFFDRRALERAGLKDIERRPVRLAEKADVRPSVALRELLEQVGATFVARENLVLVVPRGK